MPAKRVATGRARKQTGSATASSSTTVVDLDWRSMAAVLGAFVGLIALTAVVRAAPRTLAALAIAVILALAVSPLVALAERRLPGRRHGLAVAAVLSALSVLAVGGVLLLTPTAVRQAAALPSEVPGVVSDLGHLPVVGDDLVRARVPEKLQRGIEELPQRLSTNADPLKRAGRSFLDGALAAMITLLLAVGLLLDAPDLLHRAELLLPAGRREEARRLAGLAYEIVGRYVAGSLVVAAIAGVVVLVAGLVLRVPLTPLAAVWVALWDLVPQIGGGVGGLPFILLGLTHGVGTGLICAVVFLVYQQVKHQVIGPVLIGRAVRLSPPATMIAALVGISAAGVVGALVAVPVVGATKAIYLELRS